MSDVDMTGWSAEQVAAYKKTLEELAAEETRLSEVKATEEALKASPASVIAAKRAELAAKRAEREKAERQSEEAVVWDALVQKHGEKHLARVFTVEGMVVIRGNTAKEIENTSLRLEAAKTDSAKVKLAHAALRETVLHPTLETFDKLIEAYPGFWSSLYGPRDALNSGLEQEIEKKG